MSGFRSNPSGLAHLLQSPDGDVGRWLARRTVLTAAAIAAEAPRSEPTPTRPENPRHMADNIVPTVAAGPLRGEIHIPFPCSYIVNGTAAHPITPRGDNYPLRFWWKKHDRIVYPPAVRHPGTAANRFTVRGLIRGFRGL